MVVALLHYFETFSASKPYHEVFLLIFSRGSIILGAWDHENTEEIKIKYFNSNNR